MKIPLKMRVMRKNIKIVLFMFLLIGLNSSFGQDLGAFKNQKPFDITGGLRIGTYFYNNHNRDNRKNNFSYIISGSPTFSVYGIRFPFSISYRNQQIDYTHPSYKQYGVSPYYKWIKGHFGYRSMTFSPYTLAGHTFLGAGLELTPGKFRFAAMYGTLKNIQYNDDIYAIDTTLLKRYKRKAFGMKIGVGTGSNHFDLIFFKAKDDINSIPGSEGRVIYPKSNICLGSAFYFTFFKIISINANIATSSITENQNAKGVDDFIDSTSNKTLVSIANTLNLNQSSRINVAGDAGIDIKLHKFKIGLKYKHIDPLYTSYGTHYINDDIENITVKSSISFWKSRIRLNGSYGIQRSNLNNLRSYSSSRRIGSVNVFLRPAKVFNLNFRYSNYQINQNDGLLVVNDTLRLSRVNESFSLSPGLSFQGDNMNQNFRLNGSMQKFRDLNEFSNTEDNLLYNLYFNYRLKFKETKTSLKAGLNYNITDYNHKKTNRYGFTFGGKKYFFDKALNLKLSSTWNKSTIDNANNGYILSMRFGGSYKLYKKHRLSFSLSWVNKHSIIAKPYSELRGRTGYSLTF